MCIRASRAASLIISCVVIWHVVSFGQKYTDRPIGGVRWDEQNATFTGPNNIQYDFVTIAVQHNKTYYVMTFYSPDTYYKEAVRKYFQPMFNSFKFLS